MRVAVVLALVWAGPSLANPVERACLSAGRADEPTLCTCIGAAASLTLSERDQRRAAAFFSDPQSAQDIRMSDRRRDEVFWQQYLQFGQVAEDMCS